MSEESSVDLFAPVWCAYCNMDETIVQLMVMLPDDVLGSVAALRTGATVVQGLACLQAMKHTLAKHPDLFESAFRGPAHTAIPTLEDALRKMGVDKLEEYDLIYSPDGTLTPTNYN